MFKKFYTKITAHTLYKNSTYLPWLFLFNNRKFSATFIHERAKKIPTRIFTQSFMDMTYLIEKAKNCRWYRQATAKDYQQATKKKKKKGSTVLLLTRVGRSRTLGRYRYHDKNSF